MRDDVPGEEARTREDPTSANFTGGRQVTDIAGSHECPDLTVDQLGPRRVPSPYNASRYVDDHELTRYTTRVQRDQADADQPDADAAFELAGPRESIYFDSSKTRCGIVTCGGLCPGLNNVIRSIVHQLHYSYGVRLIHGFRYGFEGLIPSHGHSTIELNPTTVSHIHQQGGSILASSRGPARPRRNGRRTRTVSTSRSCSVSAATAPSAAPWPSATKSNAGI